MTKTKPTLNPNKLALHYGLTDAQPAAETSAVADAPRKRWAGKIALLAAGAVLAVPTVPVLVKDFKATINYGYQPDRNPRTPTYEQINQGINPADIIRNPDSK
jgi:hypothetical protein